PEQATAKALVLDFEACEQKQKSEPQEAHDLDRRVDRNPAQHLRSDHNPEQDLEHDRRQADPRKEPEGERRHQRRRRDNRQSTERNRAHRALSNEPTAQYLFRQSDCGGEDGSCPPSCRPPPGLVGVSLGHLALVCGKSSQNLPFLLLGHLEEVKRSPKFRRDLVELGGRDLQLAMGFFQAEISAAWFRCCILLRSTGNVADPATLGKGGVPLKRECSHVKSSHTGALMRRPRGIVLPCGASLLPTTAAAIPVLLRRPSLNLKRGCSARRPPHKSVPPGARTPPASDPRAPSSRSRAPSRSSQPEAAG